MSKQFKNRIRKITSYARIRPCKEDDLRWFRNVLYEIECKEENRRLGK